jgi:hypothetical protein
LLAVPVTDHSHISLVQIYYNISKTDIQYFLLFP